MWQHAAPASGVAAARRDAFHLTDVFQRLRHVSEGVLGPRFAVAVLPELLAAGQFVYLLTAGARDTQGHASGTIGEEFMQMRRAVSDGIGGLRKPEAWRHVLSSAGDAAVTAILLRAAATVPLLSTLQRLHAVRQEAEEAADGAGLGSQEQQAAAADDDAEAGEGEGEGEGAGAESSGLIAALQQGAAAWIAVQAALRNALLDALLSLHQGLTAGAAAASDAAAAASDACKDTLVTAAASAMVRPGLRVLASKHLAPAVHCLNVALRSLHASDLGYTSSSMGIAAGRGGAGGAGGGGAAAAATLPSPANGAGGGAGAGSSMGIAALLLVLDAVKAAQWLRGRDGVNASAWLSGLTLVEPTAAAAAAGPAAALWQRLFRLAGLLMMLKLAMIAARVVVLVALRARAEYARLQRAAQTAPGQPAAAAAASTIAAADGNEHATPAGNLSTTAASHAPQCALCLQPRSHPTSTRCGHVFCWRCIGTWCLRRPQCPICREPCEPQALLCLHNFT